MKRFNLHRPFNGRKIEEARKIRNLTLQEVAEKVNVTHQTISKYEKNKAIPSIEMINALAAILNFEPSFFYTDELPDDFFENSFIYRSKASVAKKYREQTENMIGLIHRLIENIQSKVNLPQFDNSLVKSPKNNEFSVSSDDEIEALALKVRSKFNLEDGPLGSITALCEKLGIHILYLNLNHQGIDACTVSIKGKPFIVLNNSITSSSRARFNIAHELGHILLHSNYPKRVLNKSQYSKRIEYEANRFAAAILMPESGISKDLSSMGLDYLLILKKHWKVSLQAIIYRAEQLEIFTPEYCLYLRQTISRNKWRIKEPYDEEIPFETPKLLSHALRYITEKLNISLSQLSFETGLTESEILSFCEFTPSIETRSTQNTKPSIRRVK
jgi:Zn-dependent peptidase ImmA (M78 family)/DNA-binding XRE family transcriptional regulator